MTHKHVQCGLRDRVRGVPDVEPGSNAPKEARDVDDHLTRALFDEREEGLADENGPRDVRDELFLKHLG